METAFWIVLGGVMLLLLTGMGLYLTGISRAKNASSAAFRSLASISVGILAFWATGEAIFQRDWHSLFHGGAILGPETLQACAMLLIGSMIVVGATLERSRLPLVIVSAVLMAGVISPLGWRVANTVWLSHWGFTDVGGASFIHLAGAISAWQAVRVVGPREGKYNRDGSTNVMLGHSTPLASAGLLIMLACWPVYIIGANLLAGQAPGLAGTFNVALAAAGATVASIVLGQIRRGRFDVFLIYSALLGGLVSTTAGMSNVPEVFAVLTGVVAGLIVPFVIVEFDLDLKLDDPSGLIAIHGVGGAWSLIATALFSSGAAMGRFHVLIGQLLGLVVIGAMSLVLSAVAYRVLNLTCRLRCREAEEFDGLDLSEHDLNAYPDFQQTMIKSYHLREM
jgi:Amt family ammonium transporter